jgi:hypothetical protein
MPASHRGGLALDDRDAKAIQAIARKTSIATGVPCEPDR